MPAHPLSLLVAIPFAAIFVYLVIKFGMPKDKNGKRMPWY
jgi:hypothetical protein